MTIRLLARGKGGIRGIPAGLPQRPATDTGVSQARGRRGYSAARFLRTYTAYHPIMTIL